MAASVKFAGVGRRTDVDPAAVQAVVDLLFDGQEMYAGDDPLHWFTRLGDRITLVERALEVARHRRDMLAAHLHDTLGLSYQAVADSQPPHSITPQRLSHLASRGREHIRPIGR